MWPWTKSYSYNTKKENRCLSSKTPDCTRLVTLMFQATIRNIRYIYIIRFPGIPNSNPTIASWPRSRMQFLSYEISLSGRVTSGSVQSWPPWHAHSRWRAANTDHLNPINKTLLNTPTIFYLNLTSEWWGKTSPRVDGDVGSPWNRNTQTPWSWDTQSLPNTLRRCTASPRCP